MTTLLRCSFFAWASLLPALLAASARGQIAVSAADAPPGVTYQVSEKAQRLEMIINTSRILTMSAKVPKVQVENPETVRLTPLSPNEIQISALKSGVTTVNIWDEFNKIHQISVIVTPDARELELLLEQQFPNSSLHVRPLASRVVLSGYVDRPEVVSRVIRMAEDYYPEVINNIQVGGVQTVVLEVKIMEVSRTKLRQLGFDWSGSTASGDAAVISSVSGLIDAAATAGGVATGLGGDTVRFGVLSGTNQFFGYLQALRQNNLIKVLAEPTLTTVSGRPASFNVGGEFPILIPGGLGTTTVDFKEFGTRVDFVPLVQGNGKLRLEVRPSVSEIDSARSVTINDITVPGLRTRWVDTAVEMETGQTLALAGLIQERVEAENVGLPWLSDMPWAGAMFRRVKHERNEIELLVIVTPRLVQPLDASQVPQCGPGTRTTDPSDCEFYWKGYMEVPKCCPEGGRPTAAPWTGDGAQMNTAPHFGGNSASPGVDISMPQLPEVLPAEPDTSLRLNSPQPEPTPATPDREARLNPHARLAAGTARPSVQLMPSSPTVDRRYDPAPRRRPPPPETASANQDPGLIGPAGFDELEY
jgi:pilus assembly protein CpaC